ncbi:Peroxisome biogenesis factor 10 (Peroxin-10) (Peroxisomal biogenesis factor 10) (Peroxisome assembly protein 10) (Peroxisome assembly protein PER8) [Durusdinium trenchii]|uniref:RING-type E3 ubiquitin transferase n=1 Tax=Durusdinium trenchii TaxID=1381693 RepID=A0ABP0QZ50_9DINO|eukprot:g32663.t1
MASPLPFAHPADLVRADQKDDHCRAELRTLLLETSEELLGGHAARWQGALQVLGDASYAWATAAAGSSLGEEYSELLLVENLRPAGRFRRLLAAALNAVLVNGNWGEWLMLFLRLHLALFYLFGRYRHLPERLLNLRAVSLAERPYRSFSYRPLGFVLLAQAIGQLLAKILQRRSGADVADTETLQAAMGNWAPALPQSRLSAGRPPRCNICMGPAESVTATLCGHLFCWDCIASWCAMKASCPLCRASSPPQKLLPLLHYSSI